MSFRLDYCARLCFCVLLGVLFCSADIEVNDQITVIGGGDDDYGGISPRTQSLLPVAWVGLLALGTLLARVRPAALARLPVWRTPKKKRSPVRGFIGAWLLRIVVEPSKMVARSSIEDLLNVTKRRPFFVQCMTVDNGRFA